MIALGKGAFADAVCRKTTLQGEDESISETAKCKGKTINDSCILQMSQSWKIWKDRWKYKHIRILI